MHITHRKSVEGRGGGTGTGLSCSHLSLSRPSWLHSGLAAKMADSSEEKIRVAFVGNSILYYNDCPRLLECMLLQICDVSQDSCLRGGATLKSMLEQGNGMQRKFASPPAKIKDGSFDIGVPTVQSLLSDNSWEFVVMNDHTQSPAREETKKRTLRVLREQYARMVGDAMVVFIQTAAYRHPVKNSDDLGDFDEFTERLREGYSEYANALPKAKVAPVGDAYQHVRRHHGNDLWEKLYARDDFHPSPHGTFLGASIIYCTIVGKRPPAYDNTWWRTARYMQPPDEEPLPLPTNEEAGLLTDIACRVCGLADTDGMDSSRL